MQMNLSVLEVYFARQASLEWEKWHAQRRCMRSFMQMNLSVLEVGWKCGCVSIVLAKGSMSLMA